MLKRLFIIFGYVFLVLAVVGITAALVAYGNDYTYDFGSRKIIQKGHVIIDSLPNGIGVIEDGKVLNKKTPYQAAVKVGDHKYRLEKAGYHAWEKVLQVVAGRVALADYVILVPEKPAETQLGTQTQITAQSISKDHRHLAYITGGAEPAVYHLDVNAKKTTKIYTPKVATPTTPAEIMREVSWSDDASHLLLVSDMGGVPQHRLATDSGTAEPVDLTATYGFNFTGLRFSGSNWRQMYWVSPDGLRRLDVEANAVSAVLASNVTQFWPQPDRVLYVQRTDQGTSLWSLDPRGKRQELIQALVESDSYVVAEARYDGKDELVVVPLSNGLATLYTGIYGDTPESKVLAKDINGATFSPDAHLLALTSTTAMHVYDLERTASERKSVLYTLPGGPGKLSVMTWFDDEHILSNREGELYWSEFDGSNTTLLGKAYSLFPAYSSPDEKEVITYRPTDTGVKILELRIRQ